MDYYRQIQVAVDSDYTNSIHYLSIGVSVDQHKKSNVSPNFMPILRVNVDVDLE